MRAIDFIADVLSVMIALIFIGSTFWILTQLPTSQQSTRMVLARPLPNAKQCVHPCGLDLVAVGSVRTSAQEKAAPQSTVKPLPKGVASKHTLPERNHDGPVVTPREHYGRSFQ